MKSYQLPKNEKDFDKKFQITFWYEVVIPLRGAEVYPGIPALICSASKHAAASWF